MSGGWGSNLDNSLPSPSSSTSSVDDDDANRRITPHWPTYSNTFLSRGFRLDTVRDVKAFYSCRSQSQPATSLDGPIIPGYLRAYECTGDDTLCPDPGLVSAIASVSRNLCVAMYFLSLTAFFGVLACLTARR